MVNEWLYFFIFSGIAVIFWAVLPIWRGGALWVPTSREVVSRMLELAKVRPGELLIDLGSGDGRIPLMAAQKFKAKAVGIEINFFLVWWTRLKAKLIGVDAHFIWQDLWASDVSQADVVTLFLFDWSTPKVGEKLLKECKPSVRVVSHLWRLGQGWKLINADPVKRIWVYKKLNKNSIITHNDH